MHYFVVKIRPGADIEHDHVPVVSQIRVKLKRRRKVKPQVELGLYLLRVKADEEDYRHLPMQEKKVNVTKQKRNW